MLSLNRLTLQEQRALKQFKEKVTQICGPKGWEMKIFGSRARLEGNEESDLDILILTDHDDNKRKTAIWDAAYDVFAQTDILISPQVLSKERFENLKKRERLIAQEIERDGIAL